MVRPLQRWPEREVALLVRCQECHCLSETAVDWIARIVEDDEEPEMEHYVVLYCPRCAEREFDRRPRGHR
jgi:hypothetical protein